MCVQAVFVVGKLVLQWSTTTWKTWTMGIVAAAVQGGVLSALNATYDLGVAGVGEYYKDVLYISWAASVLSVYSMKVNWVYMVIPIYAVYKLWTAVLAPMLSSSGRSSEPEETPAERKRRERKERRANKRKRI